MRRLTPKQETFCLKYFELRNATEAAKLAGYALKNIGAHTDQVMKSPGVKARLQQLQKAEEEAKQVLEAASVMGVLERKQKLSAIARANLTDFVDGDGNIHIDRENSQGLAEIAIDDWRGGEDKGILSRTKKVKLHSPIQAIDLLNKMDKMYSDAPVVNLQQNIVWVIGKGYQEIPVNADDKPYFQTDQPDAKQLRRVEG